MRLLIGLFVGLIAADMTGNWTLRYDPDFSGHPAVHECKVQQQGEKLTFSCDPGSAKFTGEIQNNRVTFEHTTGKNKDIVVRYTGAINQERSFMKGAWQYTDPADKKEKTGRFSLEKH
jgi:hypothetical protein